MYQRNIASQSRQFHEGRALKITEGRHPVVEKMLNKQMLRAE